MATAKSPNQNPLPLRNDQGQMMWRISSTVEFVKGRERSHTVDGNQKSQGQPPWMYKTL